MKTFNALKLIALFLLFSTLLPAQGWEQLYTELEDIYSLSARKVLPTDDGGFLVLLSSAQNYLGNQDFAVMRTDANGEIQQLEYIPTGITDVAFDMLSLPDGSVVIAANYIKHPENERDLSMVFLDSDFNIVQQTLIGNPTINESGTALLKRENGGYWVTGGQAPVNQATGFLMQLDDNGEIVGNIINNGFASYNSRKIFPTSSGGVKTIGVKELWGHDIIKINEYDATGQLINEQNYEDATGGLHLNNANLTADGGLILAVTKAFHTPMIIRLNETGQELWRKEYDEFSFYMNNVIQTQNGYRVLYQEDNMPYGQGAIGLFQIDEFGNEIWNRVYSKNHRGQGLDLLVLPDQGTLISGFRGTKIYDYYGIPYIIRTNNEGITYRSSVSGEVSTDINEDCVGDSLSLSAGTYITAIQDGFSMATGIVDSLGQYDITLAPGEYALQFVAPNVLWSACTDSIPVTIMADDTLTNQDFVIAYYEAPMDSIFGYVYEEIDDDCVLDSFETVGVADWIVTFYVSDNYGGGTFIDTTDSNGFYSLNNLSPYTNAFSGYLTFEQPLGTGLNCYSVCHGNFELGPFAETAVQIDVGVHCDTLPLCPIMDVSIATAGIRPCVPAFYHINYCNIGGVLAENVYIEVQLDSALTILGASIPWTSQVGNLLTFDVDNLQSLECHNFKIEFEAPCSDPLGTTYCSTAHAYPDTSCEGPSPEWDGSEIQVSSICLGDSVQFKIENIGTSNMLEERTYIIIEDNVLLYAVPQNFLLEAGEVTKINVPIAGGYYRLVAEQAVGFPGSSTPTTWIEGCGGIAPNSGIVNQYPLGDQDPWYDVFCIESVNSYDPNDKTGFPTGVTDNHYINQNEPIEYLIRFQNTGTAEALNIEIRDTLDVDYLDLNTLRPGASSHPYTWNVEGSGTLVFSFDGINLPDSTQDLEGSQGFVVFKINQYPDLPFGSEIRNTAAIYFDNNEPIITNETLHTIGQDYLSSATIPNFTSTDFAQVVPNPFQNWIRVDMHQFVGQESLKLILFDTLGKRIWQTSAGNGELIYPPSNVIPGIYFYELINEDGKIQTRKLIKTQVY